MSGSITIRRARLVLPDRVVTGDLLIEDGVIHEISPTISRTVGEEIDAHGLTALPGLIDPLAFVPVARHGAAEDLASASGAAAAGGYTSILIADPDLPATSVEALHAQLECAAADCRVNYGLYLCASDEGAPAIDAERTPGILLRYHAPWGPRIRTDEALEALFAGEKRPIVALPWPAPADVEPEPGSLASCRAGRVRSIDHLSAVARKHGRRLHIGQVTTIEGLAAMKRERNDILTAQASVAHLHLTLAAMGRLGDRAALDPPLGDRADQQALWGALSDGTLSAIASCHLSREPGSTTSPPGMPTLEWVVPMLLDLVHRQQATLRQVARWTSEAPARIFGIPRKGRLEVGFDGDLVLVDTQESRAVAPPYRTRAGWSPFAGYSLRGWPVTTVLAGRPVFRDGAPVDGIRGRELAFSRPAAG